MRTPHTTRILAPTPAWRSALWRWRHTFLAIALIAAVLTLVEALSPVPDGSARVVLAADVSAGSELRESDLEIRTVPDDAAPATSFATTAALAGRRPVVGLPAGTVLSEHLLVGPGLVAPAGHVVLPVAVADAGSLALARPGTEITLLAGAGEHSGTIAPDVLVLSVLEAEDGESLLGGSARNTVLIVAVPVHLVSVVVDASAEAPLRVALPARTGAIP